MTEGKDWEKELLEYDRHNERTEYQKGLIKALISEVERRAVEKALKDQKEKIRREIEALPDSYADNLNHLIPRIDILSLPSLQAPKP